MKMDYYIVFEQTRDFANQSISYYNKREEFY